MNEEKKVANAVPTEDDSQNSEEENGANPTRQVDRQQIGNLQNNEIGSAIAQGEGDFDNSFRVGYTSDFLEQSTQFECSTKFLVVDQGSKNNSLKNTGSNDTCIGNLSNTINDFNKQTDTSSRTNVVGMGNHIERLEMTNS